MYKIIVFINYPEDNILNNFILLILVTDEKFDLLDASFFTWKYITCPPENECRNKHHNCHPQSEQCVDEMVGFMCQCANGYRPAKEYVLSTFLVY